MKEWQYLEKDVENARKAMRALAPDFGGIYLDRHSILIGSLLKEAMEDSDDWIGYWAWECNWGKRKDFTSSITDKDGKKIPFKTLGDLYDLITKK